jgi:hypothetical protein
MARKKFRGVVMTGIIVTTILVLTSGDFWLMAGYGEILAAKRRKNPQKGMLVLRPFGPFGPFGNC